MSGRDASTVTRAALPPTVDRERAAFCAVNAAAETATTAVATIALARDRPRQRSRDVSMQASSV